MTTSELTQPFEGLLATPTARLPYQHDVLLRSYVLRRADGDVIVYNSPGISAAADAIATTDTTPRLLINHAHEGMYGQPDLDVAAWAHRDDARELDSAIALSGTFAGSEAIGPDLRAIHTPGHTPGTTSYLWDDGSHRFLFTGDCVWIEHGEWKAVVLDARHRDDYLASLERIRDIEFDVLVPWGVTEGDAPVDFVPDAPERRRRIDAIIARVAAGGDR